MSLAEDLKNVVRGDVLDDDKSREQFSTDASIFQVHPEVVVSPHSVEDIKNLVNFVNQNRERYPELTLTARAAGSDMSGGPLSESVVLDFLKYFQGVRQVDERTMTATVLPGTYYRDFEKATLAQGLLLPSYTASKSICTVGGMVANNSGGEKTLTFGKTEDYVEELKVVLADGNEYTTRALSADELASKINQNNFEGQVYRELKELIESNQDVINKAKPKVHKNSAGYYLWNVWDGKTFNINKLLVGSQGTLGLVTEIKFRLIKPKAHSALLVTFLHDFAKIAEIVKIVLAHKPESFESYDDHTMGLAMRYLPEMIKQMGVGSMFKLGLKFWPEFKMVLTGGMPKLVLVAEFTGDSEDEVYAKARGAQADLLSHQLLTHVSKKDTRIPIDDIEEDKYWAIRRDSFALLRKHVQGKHTAPFIDDIIVRPEFLPEFFPKLAEITKSYDLTYTIAGHIGDGNFHIIPLMDYSRPDFKQVITELSHKVYDLVLSFEGSITAEHNDGLVRTPFLEQMYGAPVIELFRKTKSIFDPKAIFNPHKKVPEGKGDTSTLAFAYDHIRSF